MELVEFLEQLTISGFPSLIETGRISTLARFRKYGSTRGGLGQPLLDLIDAEIAVREGSFDRALALGQAAAHALSLDHPLKARGYFVAGSAAHFSHRLEEAFELHGHAARLAVSSNVRNDSAWGRCLAALFLEDGRLRDAIHELEVVSEPRPEDRLRVFIARQHLGRLADGLGELGAEITAVSDLLAETTDPWVRTGWGNTYGYSLMLQGRYERAREVLMAAMADVDQSGLAFARPHLEWSLASVELGLRHFAKSDGLLRRVERHADQTGDFYLQLNSRVLRARLALAQGKKQEALYVTSDEFDSFPMRAMHGEYLATRALALAISGDTTGAVATAARAESLTKAVETRLLSAAVRAVAALNSSDAQSAAESLLETATRLQTWDGVVCASRACPGLITQLASVRRYEAQLRQLLFRSRDDALAKRVGLTKATYGPRRALTRREREVIDLICLGSTNAEIAATMFISTSTAKLHVRNLLRKLGARSRAEAIARYAEADSVDGTSS